jgi:hypothetical protein
MLHSPSRASYDDARVIVPVPANLNQYEDSSAFSPSQTHLHIILHMSMRFATPALGLSTPPYVCPTLRPSCGHSGSSPSEPSASACC